MSERVDFGTAKERRDRTGKGLSLLCEKPGFLSCGMAGLLCLNLSETKLCVSAGQATGERALSLY